MLYWQVLLITLAIGLVLGFVVHAVMRLSQGGSMLATLLAGMIGAFVGAYYIEPNVAVVSASELASTFTWAAIGAIVLSVIVELLFVGTRRGRVVTS